MQDGMTATAEEILKLYDDALGDINTEIQKIKYNFAKRYGIDNDKAAFFLTQAQEEENLKMLVEALENAPDDKAREDILEYIHRDGLSVRAYASRIERYEAVKTSIYARIKKLAVDETVMLGNMLKEAYKESYYGNIDDTAKGFDVGINFGILNDDAINEAVNAKWSGKRFSKRIWDNTDRLAKEAQDLVVKSIMSGESNTKTAQKLADRMQVEKFHATTLVRTETAHVHAMADLKAYEDLGIEQYKYLATLDYKTCQTCSPLDGQVFYVREAREGRNCPVMHPRCRCVTVVYTDKGHDKRIARNPLTEKNELIDGNITYSQWIRDMPQSQRQALELSRRKDSNRTADKLLHEKYKKLLGTKEVPKSFDKFVDLKYNNDELWRFLKLDYNRQSKLEKNPNLRLPNADNTTVDDRKFTEYLFGGTNERGLAKGKAFTSRLGYNIDNYAELKREIINKAEKYPVSLKNSDEHGQGYEQKIILYGKKNTPANVVVGWKEKDGKTWMTSAYIKEVK